MEEQIIGGRYQLLDEIGAGGMGTVYKGVDRRTQTLVAVKVLGAEIVQSSPILLERFYRESEALRALNHPNIVKLLDTIEENGDHFLIMEYVGGGSLKHYLLQNPMLSIKQILRIALGVADALTRTHALGIIHRDVKPSNILLTEGGTPRLTDFGVAQTHASNLTRTGTLMGTVLYLSPEAFLRQELDARADIWSFGITLFEMLTGQRPYYGEQLHEVMVAVLHAPLPDLEKLRPDCPTALVDLVYRMLTRNRAARIPTMLEVGAALEDVLRGLPATSPRLQLAAHLAALSSNADEGLRFPLPTPRVGEAHGFLPELTPFVGRIRELRALQESLNTARRVWVWGEGGVGKTRLVHQLHAADASPRAYYVDLRGYDHTDIVLMAIAHAVGCTPRPSPHYVPIAQRLSAFLQHKVLLLVLDHAERWEEAEAWLQNFDAPEYDDVQIVLVCRNPPRTPSLAAFEVPPLETREFRKRRTADEYPVTALFLDAIRADGTRYDLPDDDLKAFNQLLAATGGNPQALILAAVACRQRALPKVAEHIQRAYEYYSAEIPDLDRGLCRVRAAFDAMFDLLETTQQDALLQLSVFASKFPREAAQAVTDGLSLYHLRHLTEQGLLQRGPDGAYWLAPALADVANAYLQTRVGRLEAAWRNYEQHYADFIRKFKHDLRGFRQQIALYELRAQFIHLYRAWQSAQINHHERARSHMVGVWALYLWLDDGHAVGERLYAAAVDAIADPRAASNLNIVIKLLIRYGLFLGRREGRRDEANNWLIEGYNLAKSRGNLAEMAWAKYGLGLLADDGAEALAHLIESAQAAADASERFVQARALIALSELYAQRGDLGQFDQLNQQALHLAQEARDEFAVELAFHSLAHYADSSGEYRLVIQAQRELLSRYDDRGDVWNALHCQHQIGVAYFKRGRWTQAIDALTTAVDAAHAFHELNTALAAAALRAYAACAAQLPDAPAFLDAAHALRNADLIGRLRRYIASAYFAATQNDDRGFSQSLRAALSLIAPDSPPLETALLLGVGALLAARLGHLELAAALMTHYLRYPMAERWRARDPLVGALYARLEAQLPLPDSPPPSELWAQLQALL